MSKHECQRCGETKAADDMVKRNGKAKAAKAEAAPAEVSPKPVTLSDALEVMPGFGFRASIEEDFLVIEQDDAERNTANVTLSRTEAKVLFAQYAEWVHA